jgi:hypothetical protein
MIDGIFRRTACLLFPVVLGLGFRASSTAEAHFLWLSVDSEEKAPGLRADAFLSEFPTPDGPEFLRPISGVQISADGKPLKTERGENTYRVELPQPCPDVIDAECDLGVMERRGETFRLRYWARLQFGPVSAQKEDAEEGLRMTLIDRPEGSPFLSVRYRGEPASGAVVKVFPEAGEAVERTADDQGRLDVELSNGRVEALAKWVVKAPGKEGDREYGELRAYASLTVAPAVLKTGSEPFARLPEAVNSFGGAVLGDWLYVYSGHTGRTHHYHVGTTTKHFRRLNLKDRATWEKLPSGPALQGVALVAHGGRLYRIGGMSAHNAKGESNDLRSVTDFARFDPESRTWTALPPLPEPRSTHDAVVVGDKLYVVGGWSMRGGGSASAEFLPDALVFDLAQPDASWERLPDPPFLRRAVAAASLNGKIYVLGGLTDSGKVVKSVNIYDPSSKSWTTGPDLPGGSKDGFAPSAFEVGGRLYVSGHDGVVRRLNDHSDGWEPVARLSVPRLTHRLLPGIEHDLLIVGGSHSGSPTDVIESVPLSNGNERPR